MMIRKRRESKHSVIVVLEGIKASTEKTGIAPLREIMRDVNNKDDEILVLTLLPFKDESGTLTDACNCGFGSHRQCNQSCEEDSYINFLHQEISQKKEVYRKVFRPYYDTCKTNGVKFQVKIAAGFQPKDIIVDEANNAKATWIVIDRCFTRDLSFRLSGTECNVSLLGGDDEGLVADHLLLYDGSECSMIMEERHNPKSPKIMKGPIFQQEPCINCSAAVLQPSSPSLLASTSSKGERQTMFEQHQENENPGSFDPPKEEITPHDDTPRDFSNANIMLDVPLQLGWDVIMEITGGFSIKFCAGQNKNYMAYNGYLAEHQKHVLVKRFPENYSNILKAEKKAALSIHHKNIMQLLGYHHSDNATVLVYPLPRQGTLDDILCGLGEFKLKLKFQQKLKIAIGIAQGVRYMHEECPRGPVVHGQLQLGNIFLRHDLEPLIFGFGQATWVHVDQPSSISDKRCKLEDPLNHESMELLKSDVFSFGVLLLRLFCRQTPQNDRSLIELARPLMLEGKFYELLEEDWEISDLHGIYRVMAAATQCTTTKATSRPFMSEVISILKGENFSAIQPSPSASGSSSY